MIDSPESSELDELCGSLASLPDDGCWPQEALDRCASSGFYRWFVSESEGGFGWNSAQIAKGYLRLSAANLTVTFILTQRVAALRRIAGCENESLRQRMLEPLMSGVQSATIGISHLTTSRQHVGQKVVRACETTEGYRVSGFCPWVTGGASADWLLLGASTVDDKDVADGKEILFLVRSEHPAVTVDSGFQMIALSASQTGKVTLDDAMVDHANVVAGPQEQILIGNGGGAGGIQTSILALGLADAAIDFIESESQRRSNLADTQTSLRRQHSDLLDTLYSVATGGSEVSASEIRSQANSLALRATQSAMIAAKGAGFIEGHPVGRWCREALFFLVWSCPQSVSQANLDEFAPCV